MGFFEWLREALGGKRSSAASTPPARAHGAPQAPLQLEPALAALRSPEATERRKALQALRRLELTPALGRRLIAAAAAKDLPPGEGAFSTQAELVQRLHKAPNPSFVAPLEAAYSAMANNAEVPNAVLGLLIKIDTEESLAALVRLVCLSAGEDANLWSLRGLQRNESTAHRIFPGLLAATPHESCDHEVAETLLRFAEQRLVRLEEHPEFAARCLRLLRSLVSRHRSGFDAHQDLLDFQWGPEREALDAELREAFTAVETLADLLGWTGTAQSRESLREILELRSHRLKAFAASALTRLGAPPDAETMERLAADPAVREVLWQGLRELRTKHFPARYVTHQHLAEATVASSLYDKEGYGRCPQRLELVKVRRGLNDEGRRAAIYFYRLWFHGKPLPEYLHAGPVDLTAPPQLGHTELYPMESLEGVEGHMAEDLQEE